PRYISPPPPISLSFFLLHCHGTLRDLHSFPTRRSSDLPVDRIRRACFPGEIRARGAGDEKSFALVARDLVDGKRDAGIGNVDDRSEEHTSELQSLRHLVCRLLLEKKKKNASRHV